MADSKGKKIKRIRKLDSLSGISAEMRKVYRATRAGLGEEILQTTDGKPLFDMLKILHASHKDTVLEAKVDAIIATLGIDIK